MSGRLVVCPTPIGNLEDVTLRVLSALRDADVVACEDTRRTGVLLERYGVQATLVPYHEHNERERAAELVERMRGGAVVALVSDAGMPLVSDPGYVLVQGCVAAGLEVEVLPGPSAALAALVASALPADAWRFAGFLPRKRAGLVEAFASAGDARGVRVAAARGGVAGGARGARPVAPGRGLPRADEAARGGRAGDGGELAARYAESEPRGEVVLVVGGAAAAQARRGGGRRGAPLVEAAAAHRRRGAVVRSRARRRRALQGGGSSDFSRFDERRRQRWPVPTG